MILTYRSRGLWQAIFHVLADGRWHTVGEVFAVTAALIDPRVAAHWLVRAYGAAWRCHDVFLAGGYGVLAYNLSLLRRRGRIEVRGRSRQKEVRLLRHE